MLGDSVVAVLVVANVVAFLAMGWDKYLAASGQNRNRIPEKVLFQLAVLGGIGAWAGMMTFRHKTRHWYFYYGLPVMALAQVYLIYKLLGVEG